MRGGEERWEKLQMNKQQVGYEGRGVRTWEGTPERGGIKCTVKPAMRITYEKEEKGSARKTMSYSQAQSMLMIHVRGPAHMHSQ